MRYLKIALIIYSILLLPSLANALQVDVSGCDGTGDQVEINAAIQQVSQQGGGTVFLPAQIYCIDKSIEMQSNVCLKGESGTVILLAAHVGWELWVPLIAGTNLQKIEVCSIEFNMNAQNNMDLASKYENKKPWGRGYHNAAHFINCDNIRWHDTLMHDGLGDGLRAKTCTNVYFYDNTAYRLGHDCFFAIDCDYVEAYGNRMTTRTNSNIRFFNTAHMRIHDNVLDAQLDGLGGNPLIQGEDSKGVVTDVEICNNIMINSWGAGVWLISYDQGGRIEQEIDFHHNMVLQVGQSHNIPETGGITLSGMKGTYVHNNVFDGVYNKGINNMGGTGTIVQDNIFTNTVPHAGPGQTGTGYALYSGISNGFASIDKNCFWTNTNGNTAGCTSTNDDLADPKTHDTSSGWRWNSQKNAWECDKVDSKGLDGIIREVKPLAPGEEPIVDHDTHEIEDILGLTNVTFVDNGVNNQKADDIRTEVLKVDKGKISGGMIIGGWSNLTNYNGTQYVSGPDDILVKYVLIRNPALDLWYGGISKTKTDLNVTIKNGTATATLTAAVSWYNIKTDPITRKTSKGKLKTDTYTFTASAPAPEFWPDLSDNITGNADEYKGKTKHYTLVSAPKQKYQQKTVYYYNGTNTTHYYMLGQQYTDEKTGQQYTNFTDIDFWEGDLPHYGDSLYINGTFDIDKLKVEACTPYENVPVNVNYTYDEWDGTAFEDSLLYIILRNLVLIWGIMKLLGIILR